MIKRIFCVALCLIMCVGCLAACGNKDEKPTDPTNDVVATEPSEDVATEPSEEVTEPSEEEVTEPEVEEPVVMDVDEKIMEVFATAQAEMSETWRANMEIPVEMYADMFNLDASTYESIYGMMPMMSAHVDTLIGVKATDVEAVKAAFNAYIEMKQSDRMQYPTNAAAMGAMKVVEVGNYVWLVGIFGDTDSVAEQGEEAILKFAQDTVASVETIIINVCEAKGNGGR